MCYKYLENILEGEHYQNNIENNIHTGEETNLITRREDCNILDPLDIKLFEDRLIRADERLLITYTKRGLMKLVQDLYNLDEYDTLFNKNNLSLFCRKGGSELSKNLFLGKSTYTVEKSLIKPEITIHHMIKLMYDPVERMKWDTSLKVLKKLEGNDEAYVIRSWMHSPMFLISEREVIDKRVEFIHENVYYNISASAPEDYFPEEKDVVRCKSYINVLTLSWDDNNYYFSTLSQIDFKVLLNIKC